MNFSNILLGRVYLISLGFILLLNGIVKAHNNLKHYIPSVYSKIWTLYYNEYIVILAFSIAFWYSSSNYVYKTRYEHCYRNPFTQCTRILDCYFEIQYPRIDCIVLFLNLNLIRAKLAVLLIYVDFAHDYVPSRVGYL